MPKPKAPVTLGQKIWLVMFTIVYPFISVFTFLMTSLLSLLSGLSKGLVLIAKKIKDN